MVQNFHVVRCFRCQSFQVQQVKKAKTWTCKLCGEKQSLLKEFGRGSGADCRRHVQKLNAMRGAMMEEEDAAARAPCEEAEPGEEGEEQIGGQVTPPQVSRWSKYLDAPEEEESNHQSSVARKGLHGNNSWSRKRRRAEEPEEGSPGHAHACSLAQMKREAVTSSVTSSVTSPAGRGGSGSRWSRFLSADTQRAERSASGWGQTGGAALPCSDDVTPRRTLPLSSMFESGEEFSFD